MATISPVEEAPPVPNWLLKLEEQREKRLKAKLGHEAGAGAPCQVCENKCPGLDLHFWRKICKACKCSKENHDIPDEDIYGFVQFTLLGSKPIKAKGFILKGRKDEVILEFTPKGSSNDVKKYLEELPADMLPVKGSEAAKIRKQRLQKQMPAHDIDPSLCHALTDSEIKELEEYVAHIRNCSVGQGKIITLPLFKGSKHILIDPKAQFLNQNSMNQIASTQSVYLQCPDLSQNLQNLSIIDKNYPNYVPKSIHQTIDNQNPTQVPNNKIKDLKYPVDSPNLNIIHPLTTSNVERHQEQFENPNFELNNANLERVFNPNLNYASNYLNPIESHQIPVQIQQPKDVKYPQNYLPNSTNRIPAHLKFPVNNANIDQTYSPQQINQNPAQINQLQELNYPLKPSGITNANIDQIYNPIPQFNPSETNQNPAQINQLQDLNYPLKPSGINNANIDQIYNPIQQYNPSETNQNPAQINQLKDLKQDQNYPLKASGITNANIDQIYNPIPQYNPSETNQNPAQINQLKDLKYDQNYLVKPSGITNENIDQIYNQKYPSKTSNIEGLNTANTDIIYNPLQQFNPNFLNPTVQHQIPAQIDQLKDLKYPLNYPQNANIDCEVPPPINEKTHPKISDLTHKPQIPVLQAQNLINPLESNQNLSSVGYLNDINYPINELQAPSGAVSSPFCHECKEIFQDGGIAVTADRSSNFWHPKCFNCFTCKQPLADLLYFYHKETDNIYCGRDYAILKGIPRCAACDELIFLKEYCLAEGSTFHVKHFCCFECDEPLAGKSYVWENNQPNCLDCYEMLKAEKCNDCGSVIRPDEQGVSLQNFHWHATGNCFACKKCRKPLLKAKILLKNENLFCSDMCFKTY